jgi:hypothetical protein
MKLLATGRARSGSGSLDGNRRAKVIAANVQTVIADITHREVIGVAFLKPHYGRVSCHAVNHCRLGDSRKWGRPWCWPSDSGCCYLLSRDIPRGWGRHRNLASAKADDRFGQRPGGRAGLGVLRRFWLDHAYSLRRLSNDSVSSPRSMSAIGSPVSGSRPRYWILT